MNNNYPTQAAGTIKPVTMADRIVELMGKDGYAGTLDLDELDALRERVSRAEAERDAVAEILGTLAPGGSIVNMAEAARNVMEFRGQQLAKRDKTIARLEALVVELGGVGELPIADGEGESVWDANERLKQTVAERDAAIERLKATVSDEEVHLFSVIDMVYTSDGKPEEFKNFDRYAIDTLIKWREKEGA